MNKPLAASFLLLLSSLCIAWTIADVKPKNPVPISGNAYWFGLPYEGANHLESRGMPGVKIYIRPYNPSHEYIGPISDSFVTDSAGDFSLFLRPGNYSFISAEHAQETGLTKHFKPASCDSACYVQQLNAGDATFLVEDKNNAKVMINLNPDY